MNHISTHRDRYRDKPQTMMETIMNPLKNIKSTLRWIGAIGIGLSLTLGAPLAMAKKVAKKQNSQTSQWQQKILPKGPVAPGKKLLPGGNGPEPETQLSFTKTAQQLGCKHVRFKIKLHVQGTPGFWDDPDAFHVKEFTNASQKVTDKLPKGLSWVSATIKGDIIGATPFAFSTVSNPTDNFMTAGIKFSADKKEGDSDVDARSWTITAIAKIDEAEFPVPKNKVNQAKLKVTTDSGITNAKSHDPSLPAPADWKDGKKTKFNIDLTDCDKPGDGGGDPDGEPCIKFEKGEVECEGGPVPTFTYKMPVGPELAGSTIELTSLTPGVIVNPAFQIVPPGGGVLEWDLLGATKGMTIHLLTNNVKQVGPADFDGLAICCTEEIIIDIPEDIPCDDKEKEPDLEVTKKALVPVCDKNDGHCKFRIRVKNVGEKKFTGKLALQEWQIPHRSFIDSGPNGAWNCTYNLGLALYICKHPELTLNPGEHKDLKLSFQPGNAWPSDKIKNCAKLDYGRMGVAPFGDLTNDKDCAEICIKGSQNCPYDTGEKKPELEIRKFFSGTQCLGGKHGFGPCWVTYSIIIHNFGDAPYNGPLDVTDHFDVKPDNVQFTPMPPWNCATVDGQNFDCNHPGINLPANGQTILSVKAKFINPKEFTNKQITNCVDLNQGELGKDKDCVIGDLPDPGTDPQDTNKPDLSIEKSCKPGVLGGLISCRIMVRNNGTKAPKGIIRIYDVARVIGSNAPLTSENVTPDGPEWSCEGEPVPDLVCAINGEHLTPGTTRYFDAKIRLSGNSNERYRNCATGHHEPNNSDVGRTIIGKSCAEGGVDIGVEKRGPSTCVKGEDCTFTLIFKNNGATDFQGNVKIVDALGLGAAGMTAPISSISPPLPCANQPTSVPFVCEGNLNLGAGESQSHEIAIVFPESTSVAANITANNCAAILDPAIHAVAAKKRTNDGNANKNGASVIVGCHEFIIDNVKEEQCKAPLIMNSAGVCVCPSGSKWNGRRCAGDTSVPPVVPPVDEPQCRVGKGEFRTSTNRCICLPGLIRKSAHHCVPPVEGCKPGRNEYKNRKGLCICKPGYNRGTNGVCKKPDSCKPGRNEYKDNYDHCVCKNGYDRSPRGYCVKIPKLCKLGKNEFRNSVGQCICLPGYAKNKYGICGQISSCKPGRNEYKNKKGLCICKPGYKRGTSGYCVKKPKLCKLGTNQVHNSKGQCVCKSGYKKGRYGTCRKISTCTPGKNEYKNKQGRCVCKGGYSRNKKGICSKQTTAVPPCYSGKLTKRGKGYYCSCPSGWKRKPIGNKGGAKCTKKPVITVKPPCYSGKLIKHGKSYYCKCSKGWKRKPIGKKGGAKCTKKPIFTAKPPCYSGKLSKRGKGYYCGCPNGWKRTPIGKKGGAKCTKKQVTAKKPPCYNGRLVKNGKKYYCACSKKLLRKPIGNKGGASCVKKAIIYKPKKPVLKYKPKQPTIKKSLQFKPKNKIFIKPKVNPNKQFF